MIADQLGGKTRFSSIETTSGTGEGAKSMSYTKEGTGLPMISRPSVLYKNFSPLKTIENVQSTFYKVDVAH